MELEAFIYTFLDVDYVRNKNECEGGKHYVTRPKTGSQPKIPVCENFQVTKHASASQISD